MTDESCLGRSKGWLGSSKHWGPVPAGTPDANTTNPSEGVQGLLNDNASNPFGKWTAIFVEYCDGSSYTSDREEPVSVAATGDKIFYRGWRILNALIDDWLMQQGMDKAGAVILSGTSAGGLTAYQHAEYIRSRLPATTRVVAVPDAGFFLDLPDVDGVYKWRASLNQGFKTWNGTGHSNAACLSAESDPTRCHFPNYLLPHISTVPFFIMNSLYDTFHLGSILGLPCTPSAPSPWHRDRSLHKAVDRESQTSAANRMKCNATMLAKLQDYRDAFLETVEASASAVAKLNHGYALTGCMQHEEICRDEVSEF
eukprot:SAG31_NODE_7166_length_1768_cov_2.164170_2_plen_312_part_00